MKVLVAYDGSLGAKDALRYGIKKVHEVGGELVALTVFHSPMYFDYEALPQAEEKGRRESFRFAAEAESIIKSEGAGIKAALIMDEGDPIEQIIACAREEKADLLLCPPRYKAVMKQFAPSCSGEEALLPATSSLIAVPLTSRNC